MRVVITGGGTGGHIYPALAIAHQLKDKHNDLEILYIGSQKGLERQIVSQAGLPYQFIDVEGLKRQFSIKAVKTAWLALSSILKARKILAQFRPDVVIGTGGYVVVPVIFAARLLKIKTGILELDAHTGLANRMVMRRVDTVMLGMKNQGESLQKAKRVVLTGNPRATEVANWSKEQIEKCRLSFGLDQRMPVITIVSGSRGAKPINEAVKKWLSNLDQLPYRVIWITGEVHFKEIYEAFGTDVLFDGNVTILPYYHDMPSLLYHTTVIVCRAGATTLAEITSLGIPAILIPSPYVTHRHQDRNASVLVEEGAAIHLPEDKLDDLTLQQTLQSLIQSESKRDAMHHASLKIGKIDALDRIDEEIMHLLS